MCGVRILQGSIHRRSLHAECVPRTELLNVRPDASTRNARVDVLSRGTTVQVLSIENGWAKIVRADGSEAYVFAKHIRKV